MKSIANCKIIYFDLIVKPDDRRRKQARSYHWNANERLPICRLFNLFKAEVIIIFKFVYIEFLSQTFYKFVIKNYSEYDDYECCIIWIDVIFI